MSVMVPLEVARHVVDVARRLLTTGLSVGTSGNVSARVDGGFLVTPSGMPYEDMSEDDLVFVSLDGTVPPGQLVPSSEWRIHRDVYVARPDVGGVVHAHPPLSGTVACMRLEIPAIHYMVAVAGGSTIRCAEYATFGTEELSRNVIAALEGRKACLMANHGIVALGPSCEGALALAVEVENLAGLYLRALQVGGGHVLDDEEMARVLERFAGYGPGKRG